MFTGTYDHNIDEKNRITFPVRFREQVGEGAHLVRWFDDNLVVMTDIRFNALAENVNALPFGDPDARELQRFLFGNASDIDFDKSGRFIIPQNLREFAHLDGEATVVGSGEKIEIWSPVLLKQRNERFKIPNAAAELASKFNISF
jgi:MraZ protein